MKLNRDQTGDKVNTMFRNLFLTWGDKLQLNKKKVGSHYRFTAKYLASISFSLKNLRYIRTDIGKVENYLNYEN